MPRHGCRLAIGAVALIACGGGARTPPPSGQPSGPEAPPPEEAEPEPVAQPEFPDGTRLLELVRTVGVRLEPGDDAKRIGTIAIDTRVAWTRSASGKGCTKRWIEIAPQGWICGDYVKPSKQPPYGQEVPHLDRGELVPGIYGKVTAPSSVTYMLEKPEPVKKPGRHDRRDKHDPKKGKPITSPAQVDDAGPGADAVAGKPHMVEDKPLVGSVNVRQYEEVTVDGKVYWKISQKDNQYVLRSAITPHTPSRYGGTRLGDDTGWAVPFAFVWPRAGYLQAWTTNKAGAGGVNRQLDARTPIPILETSADKAGKPVAYRIGDAEWISAADVRVFEPHDPPALLQPGERWVDVDVDAEILVAYEGETPVYATLVSSGAKDTPTETGVYRMWLKESEADMKGLNGEDPYSVATVPWTQFFSPEKGLALHTAYWHDAFGTRRSHGCVNLAPRDARWLYFWSDPQVPPGWTMSAGVVEAPGSIVRIRSAADPDPEVKGYAKKVIEVRQQLAPAR